MALQQIGGSVSTFGVLILSWFLFFSTTLAAETKITFALWGNPETVESKMIAIDLFQRDYPDVEIEILVRAFTEHHEKLYVEAAAGNMPDVILVSSAWWPGLNNAGLLEPLNAYIESDPGLDWDDYLYRNTVLHDGRIIGLPEHEGPMMLTYNVDRFSQAGLQTPDELYREGESSWNWETYLDVARRLSVDADGDGTPEVYGSATLSGANIYRLLHAAGGSMYSEDRRRALPNVPAAEASLQFALDLIERNASPPVGQGVSFESGNLGMWNMNGQPFFRAYHTDLFDFAWNIAPHPAGPEGFHNLAIVNPVVVSAHSKHKRLGYILAKYLTSAESQMEKVRQGHLVAPVRVTVLRSPEFRGANAGLNLDLYFDATVTNVHLYPAPLAGGPEAQRIIFSEFNAALSKEKPISEAVQEIKRRIDQFIADNLREER